MPPSARKPDKLTARSAVLSALLGAHPAEATTGGIIEIAGQLGFQESAIRVALTRMVAAGDLERDRGVHRLSPRLIARQERQDAAISAPFAPWDRQWSMIVVTAPADAGTRAATRTELSELRYGELREGVWLRPDNLDTTTSAALDGRSTRFTAEPVSDPEALTERLFAPGDWADAAETLLRAAAQAEAMPARFEVAAAAVRHILHDPLLPVELLPADWPGRRLRDSYAEFRNEFGRFVAHTLDIRV